jgi:hypothetical protein
MSRFTSTVGTTDSTNLSADTFTRNSLACAGTGVFAGLAAGSVLTIAIVAPLHVGFAAVAGTGLLYAGKRQAEGKSVMPTAPKSTPVAAAPAAA